MSYKGLDCKTELFRQINTPCEINYKSLKKSHNSDPNDGYVCQ